MHCRVKCWAFAPPGGLADPHVAEAAQEFCTSVVLGKDWIPRLTVHSFERLRDEMVRTCCERKRKETKRKRKGKKGKNEKKEEKQGLMQWRCMWGDKFVKHCHPAHESDLLHDMTCVP